MIGKQTQTGEYNRQVDWEQPLITQGDNGEELIQYLHAFTTPAKIRPLRGNEKLAGGGVLADLDTMITVRYSPRTVEITAKWRARRGSLVYNVMQPPSDIEMAHVEIELLCRSGLNAG